MGMNRKAAMLGMLGMALAMGGGMDIPSERSRSVGVSGNFDGLNSRITNRRKPKPTNHKRSKKRKHQTRRPILTPTE